MSERPVTTSIVGMTNAQLIAADSLDAATGVSEAYLLEQLGVDRATVLTIGSGTDGYEVVEDCSGQAAGSDPKAATVLYFDGPVSPAGYDAAVRAGRDRIQPALRAVPGLIRTVVLWDALNRASVVIHFAESVEALDAAARVASSTTLLPGEDPALLPGPDRAEVHHVTAVRKETS